MTTSISLIAADGSSLTEAYVALKTGHPEIFQDLKTIMTGQKRPEVLGGSGEPDLSRLQIDLKHLPPECAEELRPIFSLIRKIIQNYSGAEIIGEIIITESQDVTKIYF